jgi:hypothetical protein
LQVRRPALRAQLAAVSRIWVVAAVSAKVPAVAASISAAALRDLGLVPAAARLGLVLVVAVAARLARGSSAVAVAAAS